MRFYMDLSIFVNVKIKSGLVLFREKVVTARRRHLKLGTGGRNLRMIYLQRCPRYVSYLIFICYLCVLYSELCIENVLFDCTDIENNVYLIGMIVLYLGTI